jgi:hypothetical protein
MAQNIGISAPTRIPTFGDDASIEEALRKYHYGVDNWDGDPVQDNLGMDGNFKAVKARLTEVEAAITDIVGDGGGFIRSESKTANPNTIVPQTASIVPLTIKGTTIQTANLQQWQNVSNTNLAIIFSNGALSTNGYLTIGATTQSSTTVADFRIGNSAHKGITVRGATSQTGTLQEWQNSAGTVLTSINALGHISSASANVTTITSSNATITNVVSTSTNSANITSSNINASQVIISGNQPLTSRARNIVISTSNPSGGNDGDVWLTYS